MNRRQRIVYTLRNVPDGADARVRETAVAEGISLNSAVLRLIERGLGGEQGPARRRDLRQLPERISPAVVQEWRTFLKASDAVDPEKWK